MKIILLIIGCISLFTNIAVAQNNKTENLTDSLQNLAIYHRNQGNYQQAINYINKAINEFDKNNYDKYAELLSNLALFHIESGNTLKAIDYQTEVVRIREHNSKNDEDKTKLAISLYNIINYCDIANDSVNSFKYNHKLIDNNYPLEMFEFIYLNMYNLSNIYLNKKDTTKAILYAKKAIKHCIGYKEVDEHRDNYIYLVCYLRDIYVEIGNYEQAIEYQNKYIETFTDKNSDYATAIALLAEYYTKKNENEANILLALDFLKEAANIRLELEGITSDSFIRTQLNIANHLITLGQYNESIKYLESCLSNLDSNSDRYILCLRFMATAYARLKNNNKAIELFQEMQEKAIERKDTLSYLESIVEIAEYDTNLKNLNNNIEKCQDVINTVKNIRSSNIRILELYNNAINALGNLYIRYGNHKQASICFEKSLKNTEFKEGKNSFNYLGRGSQLVNCYTYTDIKKADSLSLLLLDIAHNMSNNRYLAHLNNRSIILSIMKRHEEAIKCLEEVRDSYRIIYGVNNPIYATVCHNIGIDYSYIRKDSIAINYFNEALRIRKIHENSNPFEYLETLYSIITSKMSLNIDCKNDAEHYLSKCILLLSDIKFMSSEQRFLFHKSFNKKSLDYIVFNNIEDTELLYNYILFSKELLLELDINNDINRQLYTWNHLKQKMREDDIAIEFINYPKDEQANLWQYDALIIKKDYEIPKRIRLFEIDNNDNDFIDIMAENICKIWDKLLFDFSEKDNIYFTPIDVLYNYYPIESLCSKQ